MMALMMQMYQTTYESGVCLVVLLSENFWNLEFQWIGLLQNAIFGTIPFNKSGKIM